MQVQLKRVYDAASDDDGLRILIDKLWPRGIKKENLRCDLWEKNISPSDALRKAFHADVDGYWNDFRKEYSEQLDESASFADLISRLRKTNPEKVTLLYAFKNQTKNNALIVRDKILSSLKK